MNAPAVDISDMLEYESNLDLIFKEDLFVGYEPSTPDNCVTIFDTSGYPPEVTFEGNPNFYKPSIQIRVRNKSYLDGYELISGIVRALHGRGPELWNGTTYCSIICTSDPALLDWDANGRARFIANFNITRRI